MLASLVLTHRERLDTLAAAWLAAGAGMVAIRDATGIIGQWPANCDASRPDMVAPIKGPNGKTLGELCCRGQVPAAAARLAADAALIAALAETAGELDSIVEALAETEDQLLALYELTRPGPSRLNVDQILSSTARQAVRLVKAEGAFVVLNGSTVVQHP